MKAFIIWSMEEMLVAVSIAKSDQVRRLIGRTVMGLRMIEVFKNIH
jgi:hypothetical protein